MKNRSSHPKRYIVAGVCLVILASAPILARQNAVLCGTNPEHWKEERFLHHQAMKSRRLARVKADATPVAHDVGNIAVIEDSDGVVARRNDFNLDHQTLTFTPTTPDTTSYEFRVTADSFDRDAAAAGDPLSGLGDDDTRAIALPFAFPFFGASYRQAFVNSDGNITFGAGDVSHDDRSLGRMVADAPRIAALYSDLDPSSVADSVRFTADETRVTITWAHVPEYSDFGFGNTQTFQLRLYPDGHIDLTYDGVNTSGAVVGISPGSLLGTSTVLSFSGGSGAEFSSTVAERFGGTNEIDIETAAQKFYRTHEDAYDYLVIYNNLGIPASRTAVAFEQSVRSLGTGYGKETFDDSSETGSAGRLQALLNMGPLSQYPSDPAALVTARASVGDTPITVLGHEAGHLFLAYVSVPDPANSQVLPMLGFQNAHWNFLFDSEASLLEGNRILDNGPGASPRFVTTATVEGYSPLDQYLMGFRNPEEVPPVFYVANSTAALAAAQPRKGVAFDGERRDVGIADIIRAAGRRTPDATVAQRQFRFAFILVTTNGTAPSATDLQQMETYRTAFEAFYSRAASQRAGADTTLRRALKLSVSPAAGVVLGGSASAAISIQSPAATPLLVYLSAPSGVAKVPESVSIPAAATSVSFSISGIRAGVEELSAQPDDNSFEASYARVQVSPASALNLETVWDDRDISGIVALRVTDANRLPYPGIPLRYLIESPQTAP